MISIKVYRGLKDVSQKELAQRINMSRQYLSLLEREDAIITPNQVKKIAEALNVSPIELYGLDNFKIKPTTREEKQYLIKLLQDSIEE